MLADIIASERVPVARLTEVFRQAAESRIVVNAHRINHGQMPEPPKSGQESDFYMVEIGDPEEGIAKLIEIVTNRSRAGSGSIRPAMSRCSVRCSAGCSGHAT